MSIEITRTVAEARKQSEVARGQGLTLGLVPTMGALHEGHASLMRAAKKRDEHVTVSIFVNPTQFAPNEDLARYPRTWNEDIALCEREGVDHLFAPVPDEVYPKGFQTYVEVRELQRVLCGKQRPTHFIGVATVVLKLFNILCPHRAYFGQKDAQQVILIKRMVRDLDVPVEICVCPIVREADGLAMSSRNRYLDANQRQNALVLYRSLQEAEQTILSGERDARLIKRKLESNIAATSGAECDYVEIVDADMLQSVEKLEGQFIIALAVRFGATRLIDNTILTLK